MTESIQDDTEIRIQRESLVEQVADMDPHLADLIIERESLTSIKNEELRAAIGRVMYTNSAVPVLMGTSYKNVGVQPLLDAIITYIYT